MNVQELYQQKLTTAEEAVKIVKSGDWVDYGWCCNQPVALDKENKKISLGYKREEDNPWNVFKSKYDIGSVAEVKILKFMPFGAFAEIVPGVDGLIHISQIADRRIEKPEDVLSEGQTVEAKITAIDEEKQKISLSIRALLAPTADEEDAPVEE